MTGQVVITISGLLLVLAGALKAIALSETAVTPGAITRDWWLQLAAVGWELILGVWLLIGVFPVVARWVAAAVFTVFTIVSISKGLEGEASCGCLGRLQLSPWVMAGLDAAVVLALVTFSPSRKQLTHTRPVGLMVLAGATMLAAGVTLRVYQSATTMARNLSVDEPDYHFGDVRQNSILVHEFLLNNGCPYPVEVVRSASTCGCTTVAAVDGQIVPAGGQLAVPITLTTGEGEEEIGGRLTLYCRPAGTDIPPTFFRKLRVAANVEADYWVRPEVVNFGVVSTDEPVTRLVRVRPHRMPDVRIQAVTSSDPAVQAELLPERTSDGDFQVKITFCGRGLTGDQSFGSRVVLETTSRGRPRVGLLVKARYEAPVTVSPKAVVASAEATGTLTRTVQVTARTPVRVIDVSLPEAVGHADIVEESPTRWQVNVTLPAETETTGAMGELRFTVAPLDATAAASRAVIVPVYRLRSNPTSQ